MKLNHINKIKANISIYSSKKTTNILDGTYKSVYKGKSMNFENIREYVINDDIKDIDWKSSARSGTLLIKQFIAEKKHNILIVLDSGIKMQADTDKHEEKKQTALYIAGTIGYIAIKNGDYVGLCYYDNKTIFKPFKDTLYNLEEYLCCYENHFYNKTENNLNTILKYIYKNITKKTIIFIITDISGLDNIDNNIIKQLSNIHDIMLFNINDNFMFGQNIYDVENKTYIPNILLNDSKLYNIEKQIKKDLYIKNKTKLRQNKICITNVSSIKEINNKLIELLEEHKYASNR